MKQSQEQGTEEAVDAEDLTYDKTAKQVLAARQILAPILKKSVAEFSHLSLETIARECIMGTPWVGTVPVDPGRTNRVPERIRGSQTEQSDLGEGWITFDVLFYARVPGTGRRMKFIINIEAQRNTTKYKLMKRAMFYASRLISSQKERDFTGQDYDSICKVYTIWLCFYLPEDETSSINQYELKETNIYGKHHEAKADYDLINITTIHIGD
ncbi:MAG: PD-(D/E)XK nuclease family transposase, partial [Selenomonas sp.]|nr:PD-(D/E)XK nuclease family transposase [Selenomonas sp.]